MKQPVKLDAAKQAFTVRIQNPAQTLGIPALGQFAPNTLDLEFRARSEDEKLHFNLYGMEKITGLSYAVSQRNTLIVGPASLMGAPKRPAKTKPAKLEQPFSLAWDHVGSENKDPSAEEAIPSLHVISPTWFALTDEAGASSNRGSAAYVEAAHASGYHVWGLVSNGFNKGRTKKFLASRQAQDLFIARLLAYAGIYGFDGINIDFENVDNGDAARLTAFVKRLSTAAKSMGLTMSIDIMIPTKWSTCYQRGALSKAVDYVAVMTYDEHWRTSPKSGSTASLPWVRAGLQKTLAEVPANKLLLGIPFYTREWEETKKSDGKVSVKSRALGMASVDLRQQENSAAKMWQDNTGQHYFEYAKDGKRYRIWVEDEKSIQLRMAFVKKHKLAGAAFWRKGFEKPEIWTHVQNALEADTR